MEFYEQQKFDQKWMNTIIYSILILSVVLFIVIFFEKAYIIATIVLLLGVMFFGLLKCIRLVVKIDQATVKYKFFPVHIAFKTIVIDHTLRLEVVAYDPISEFGGWGIRINKHAKCYSTSGYFALKITMTGRKDTYIGTNEPDELRRFIGHLDK